MQNAESASHSEGDVMIRPCRDTDVPRIETIINEAASAYEGVIPADCWQEPYMARAELLAEISAGVQFWGWDDAEALLISA